MDQRFIHGECCEIVSATRRHLESKPIEDTGINYTDAGLSNNGSSTKIFLDANRRFLDNRKRFFLDNRIS